MQHRTPIIILYAAGMAVPYGIPTTREDAYVEVQRWHEMRMLRCNDSYWIVPGTWEDE